MREPTSARDLAGRFGLKTADTIPRPTPKADNSIIARGRRSRIEKLVEEGGKVGGREIEPLGIAVVTIIGHLKPVPRYMGDNQGGRAVRVACSADPKLVYLTPDRIDRHGLAAVWDRKEPFWADRDQQTAQGLGEGIEPVYGELLRCYVPSDRHMRILSTPLETALGAKSNEARHEWRYVDPDFPIHEFWTILRAVVDDVNDPRHGRRTLVEPFDYSEMRRRYAARAKQIERMV